jgi:hypothetical protein
MMHGIRANTSRIKMKRRVVLAGGVGAAGIAISRTVSAAIPGPPPQVSVSGGTTALTDCPSSGSTYSTSFGATENPLSEGGRWINGGTVGLDWTNVQTTPGKAFATTLHNSSTYRDNIAHLAATFNANQQVSATIYRANGYSPSILDEIELLLRFQITAHSARGYEVMWEANGRYMAIAQWNGSYGNFAAMNFTNSPPTPRDGDVLTAKIVGNTITVYVNGSLVLSDSTASTWNDGHPGIGFNPVTPGSTLGSYGWKNFTATSL